LKAVSAQEPVQTGAAKVRETTPKEYKLEYGFLYFSYFSVSDAVNANDLDEKIAH